MQGRTLIKQNSRDKTKKKYDSEFVPEGDYFSFVY